MKQLERKLRSNAGASMIFALVFLLFCVFIGGSVLAAATANAGRVASMTTDQQEYLSQRSAALVMADMLTGTDDAPMQMTIKKVEVLLDGGATSNRTFYVTIPSSASKPVIQKVVYENVLDQIWKKESIVVGEDKDEVNYENFLFDDMSESSPSYSFTALTDEMPYSFSVANSVNTSEKLEGEIQFVDDYDLKVHFGNNSQVYLSMNGYASVPEKVEVKKGNTTTTTTTTIIRWDPPVIEKGGVSDE